MNTLVTIKLLKQKKKLVIEYGASTKGNVLLQYYGITKNQLPYIADRNPLKYNLRFKLCGLHRFIITRFI